ncbi:hypothetical protein ACFYZH_31750 [Streptomyces abikoensis]|uniref:hypothetical protein n=1 Tax=Streptomyces abikoensis TaxID=97398 RepID=UPI0036945FDA
MADNFHFPDSLRQAQLELHQVTADLAALGRTLPWSVVPLPGWSRPDGHWYPSSRPDSPGWTEEQQQQVAALRARALELSIAVGTHPFWSTVEKGKVVEARMALKRVHEDAGGDEAAGSGAAAA